MVDGQCSRCGSSDLGGQFSFDHDGIMDGVNLCHACNDEMERRFGDEEFGLAPLLDWLADDRDGSFHRRIVDFLRELR